MGSPWICGSLGGKPPGFGSFSCWKAVMGRHCHTLELLHTCAVPRAHVHVGLCQMCPHVLTYRCPPIRVFTCSCHCMVVWLRRHIALHTRAHLAMHASRWSHRVTHVDRSPHGPTHVFPCPNMLPAPSHQHHDSGCPWGCATWGAEGRQGGNHGAWVRDLTLPPCSHGLWRGQPRPAGPPLRPPGWDPPQCGTWETTRHLA